MRAIETVAVLLLSSAASCVVPPSSQGDGATDVPDAWSDASADIVPWVEGGGAFGCAVPTRAPIDVPARGASTTVSGVWRRFDEHAWNSPSGPCAITNRGDHAFPFALSERSTVEFSVTSRAIDGDAGATGPDLKIALRRQCDSSEGEVACDLDSGPGANPALRATLDPGTYFLILDGDAIDGRISVAYDVSISNIADDPRGTCAGALSWTAGTTVEGDTRFGSTAHRPCFAFGPTGREVFFRYVLPPLTRSMLRATTRSADWSAVVLARESCDSNSCVSVGDATNVASVVNGSASPRAFIVSVRASELGTGGAFTLSDSLSMLPPPPAGAICETAVTVGPNTTLTGQTASVGVERRRDTCALLTDPGRESFTYYRVVVAPNHTLTVQARPDEGSSARLLLFEGCSPTECLRTPSGSATLGTYGAYRNRSASDKVITIAVGSGLQSEARFDLDVRVLAPSTNTTCATAATLSLSSPVIAAGAFDSSTANPHVECVPDATGNVVFYRMTVPARQAAFVDFSPFNPHTQIQGTVRVADGCDSRSCVTSSRSPAGMVLNNASDADREYIVTVGGDARFGDVVGALTTRVSTPAPNATCAAARVISDGETIAMQSSEAALERRSLSTCEIDASGLSGYANQLYFQIVVPAQRTGVVRVRPSSGAPASVSVFASCSPTACASSATSLAGRDAIVRVANTTLAPQTYVVAASAGEQRTPSAFSLSYAVMPSPMNTTCAAALELTPGVDVLNQNQSEATETNRLSSCMPSADGRVLYYSAAVPAGQGVVLNAMAVGAAANSAVWRTSDSCSSITCLANASRELSWVNTSASSRAIIATLGSASSATSGAFDVSMRFFAPRAHSTCATAIALAARTTLAMQDTAAGGEQRWDGCSAVPTRAQLSTLGPKLLFYSVTVAPGERARITLSSFVASRATAVVFEGCSATACTNVDQRNLADRQITSWRNDTGAARTYLVGVGSSDTLLSSQFTIERE